MGGGGGVGGAGAPPPPPQTFTAPLPGVCLDDTTFPHILRVIWTTCMLHENEEAEEHTGILWSKRCFLKDPSPRA